MPLETSVVSSVDLAAVEVAAARGAKQVGAPFDAARPKVLFGLFLPYHGFVEALRQMVTPQASTRSAMCAERVTAWAVGEKGRRGMLAPILWCSMPSA